MLPFGRELGPWCPPGTARSRHRELGLRTVTALIAVRCPQGGRDRWSSHRLTECKRLTLARARVVMPRCRDAVRYRSPIRAVMTCDVTRRRCGPLPLLPAVVVMLALLSSWLSRPTEPAEQGSFG